MEVLNALSCLLANLDPRSYSLLGLGPGLDVIAETRYLLTREIPEYEEVTHSIMISKDCVRHVQYLSMAVFCQLLVNHFAILFRHNQIV